MQMGVGERQDIGHPVPPSDHAAGRAPHMRGSMTSMVGGNHLVVEETMICCGYILTSNPTMTFHSGADMAETMGRRCESIGHLNLGTDRVSAWSMTGNSVELPFRKAGHLKRHEDRRWNTTMQALWGTREVILGLGSSSYWGSKACVGWTCSNEGRDSWSWVGLNWCVAGC